MQFKLGQQVKLREGAWSSLEGLVGVVFKLPTTDENYYGVIFTRNNDYESTNWYFYESDLQYISKFQYFYSI